MVPWVHVSASDPNEYLEVNERRKLYNWAPRRSEADIRKTRKDMHNRYIGNVHTSMTSSSSSIRKKVGRVSSHGQNSQVSGVDPNGPTLYATYSYGPDSDRQIGRVAWKRGVRIEKRRVGHPVTPFSQQENRDLHSLSYSYNGQEQMSFSREGPNKIRFRVQRPNTVFSSSEQTTYVVFAAIGVTLMTILGFCLYMRRKPARKNREAESATSNMYPKGHLRARETDTADQFRTSQVRHTHRYTAERKTVGDGSSKRHSSREKRATSSNRHGASSTEHFFDYDQSRKHRSTIASRKDGRKHLAAGGPSNRKAKKQETGAPKNPSSCKSRSATQKPNNRTPKNGTK